MGMVKRGSHSLCVVLSPLARCRMETESAQKRRLVGLPVRTGSAWLASISLRCQTCSMPRRGVGGGIGGGNGEQAATRGVCRFAGFLWDGIINGRRDLLDRGIRLFKAPGCPQQVASIGLRWTIPILACPGLVAEVGGCEKVMVTGRAGPAYLGTLGREGEFATLRGKEGGRESRSAGWGERSPRRKLKGGGRKRARQPTLRKGSLSWKQTRGSLTPAGNAPAWNAQPGRCLPLPLVAPALRSRLRGCASKWLYSLLLPSARSGLIFRLEIKIIARVMNLML